MSNPDPHQLISCPYNMAHQVEHYRMHNHLQKCRKQYPNSNKSTCPFDATHIIRDVELDYHVSICPKRVMLDQQIYITDDDYRPVVQVQPPPAAIEVSENWEDYSVKSYNPTEAKKGAHVITKIKGATPSERRKARMEAVKNYRPFEPTN